MVKEATLATATAVGAEAPILKSTAKTPKKPKGWKKWKRRLSQVFTGKKKSKKKHQQSATATPEGEPKASIAQRDHPQHQSRRRQSDGSTDGSPDGSEKDADRRSADSCEWRRRPRSQDHYSAESRSAREPTDEEWEAEQRRLARQEDDGEDERSYADEGDDDEDFEYDDEEFTNEEEAGVQSDEEQDELQEDVYDYNEEQEAIADAQVQPGEIEENDTVDASLEDGNEPIRASECQEQLSRSFELVVNQQIQDADVDSEAVIAVENVNDGESIDGRDEEELCNHTEPRLDDENVLHDVAEEAVLCVDEDQTDAQMLAQPEDSEEEDHIYEEEEEEGGDDEEDGEYPGESVKECSHQEATVPILDIESVGGGEAVVAVATANEAREQLTALLELIPTHMTGLRDVAEWCFGCQPASAVDVRLLMACIKHLKWAPALLLAEMLRRDHVLTLNGSSTTEALLDSVLAFCTA